jgi:molybdopterin synthase catalytic subunit
MLTHIRLFATYREQAGTDRMDLTLSDGATVADVVADLLKQCPGLPRDFRPHLIAVNEEFATLDYLLHDEDEVALYPPVSGGVDAAFTTKRIDTFAVADLVRRASNGAVITFEGATRNDTDGKAVSYLEYEAHLPMAQKVLAQVLEETAHRFDVEHLAARHRTGHLEIGETSLVVAIGAPHRKDAFLAAQYVVDRIKQIVPVWKKEFYTDQEGTALHAHTGARTPR